jgi:glycerophosphoryl diester phosphodiesterase
MNFSVIALIFVLFISCKNYRPLIKIENLNGNRISVLGHGGMGMRFKFPVNSDESLNTCLSLGSDGTECDIQLSADSVLIIYHDNDLYEKTLCSGVISNKNWPDLLGCDYTRPFSSKLNILSLKGWYNSIKGVYGSPVIALDCKLRNGTLNYEMYRDKFARAVLNFITENSNFSKVNVESSDIEFLKTLRKNNPLVRTFLYTSDIQGGINSADFLTGITINTIVITASDIRLLHSNNLQVALFGMLKKKDNMLAIEKSPDFVQCDKIIEMLQLLDRYKK